jgi:hypothetical protein
MFLGGVMAAQRSPKPFVGVRVPPGKPIVVDRRRSWGYSANGNTPVLQAGIESSILSISTT